MKRAAPLALACLACAVMPAGAADARRRPAPARLLVEAREFNLTLSRTALRRGPAVVQLANRGEDGHDLRIVPVGGGRRRRIPETHPGATALWIGKLRPGRYRLYCSLPGHAAAGMRATLRVR